MNMTKTLPVLIAAAFLAACSSSISPDITASIVRINGQATGNDTIFAAERLDAEIEVSVSEDVPAVGTVGLLYVWPDEVPRADEPGFVPGGSNLIIGDVNGLSIQPGETRVVTVNAWAVPGGNYKVRPTVAAGISQITGVSVPVTATNSDNTPPEIVTVTPDDGAVMDSPYFDLAATVSDDGGIFAWRVSFEWSVGTVSYCADGERSPSGNLWGTTTEIAVSNHSGFCAGQTLQPGGDNLVRVSAWDNAFNRTEKLIYLTYQR